MRRTSIFSNDYHDRMKKRKIRNVFILLGFVIIVAAVSLSGKIDFKKIAQGFNPVKKQTSGASSVKTDSTTAKTALKPNSTTDNSTVKPSAESDVKGYTVKLSDGQELKAVYEESGNIKKFKSVLPETAADLYQISPSGNGIVFYDKAVQGIIYVKIDGTISDISQKQYVATDKTVFQREEVLKNNPNYVWCNSPKFIDDETIVYISQLPWFKTDTTKYIWTYNVTKPDSYQAFQSLVGNDITIGAVTVGKGISIKYDGNNKFLSAAGDITQ